MNQACSNSSSNYSFSLVCCRLQVAFDRIEEVTVWLDKTVANLLLAGNQRLPKKIGTKRLLRGKTDEIRTFSRIQRSKGLGELLKILEKCSIFCLKFEIQRSDRERVILQTP